MHQAKCKENGGSILNPLTAFSINRLDNDKNFETGLSATVGVDYSVKKDNSVFDFSLHKL